MTFAANAEPPYGYAPYGGLFFARAPVCAESTIYRRGC